MSVSRVSSPGGRLRLWPQRLVLLAAIVMIVETWLVDGLLVSCRISGGSMAAALVGRHFEVPCRDCGFRFACDAESLPLGGLAVCPNCGCADNELAGLPVLAGDGLVIDRSVFQWRAPRRWEVIVLRRPHRAGQVDVKRVVGLPGETIHVRAGDVYVVRDSGVYEIQRKALPQQRAMAVLVHDASCRPTAEPAPPPRWRGETPDSQWGWADGQFTHAHIQGSKQIDRLVYYHWRRLAGRNGEVSDAPVTDLCGYNQGRPRREEDLHPVVDLMLSLRLLQTWGYGWMNVEIGDGREQFEVRIYPDRKTYEAFHQDRPIPGGSGRLPAWIGSLLVEVSLFDRQLLLALNGRTAVIFPYESDPQGTGQPGPPTMAIGAKTLGLLIGDVRVYRDVYYTRPVGLPACPGVDGPYTLPSDEYYVLGDNSAVSEDSRTWPGGPGLGDRFLEGRPLLVLYAAEQVDWGGWVFQVPDPAKIRYIH